MILPSRCWRPIDCLDLNVSWQTDLLHTLMPTPIEPQTSPRHPPKRRGNHILLQLDPHCINLVSAVVSMLVIASYFWYACKKSLSMFVSKRSNKTRSSLVNVTYTTIPSHVIKMVQLKPSIDINPKFRYFPLVQITMHTLEGHLPSKRGACPSAPD
jgi:hypothetical protein